ncbi:fimbria/pilus periplasmic chaperone [Synechocystis sp. LKSZ1]|uniref:fimbrial biogenesis chaperone n=1 Tax=Synechocystis sp. LKSZ1 TaxID=3144951 RepID=UPI00336BBA4D
MVSPLQGHLVKINFKGFALAILVGVGINVINPVKSLATPSFQLTPMEMQFTPSGGGVNRSFLVQSAGDKPIAVQITIVKRQMAVDGAEVRTDAEEDFIIYPPQIILQPNQTQSVRVTWLGESSPTKELAYRIIAEQVPIESIESQPTESKTERVANIKVLFKYEGTIYITPSNASPQIILQTAESLVEKDRTQLVLNFENQGTAHQLLNSLKVTLTSNDGKTVTLQGEQLKGVIGENILAGNKRRFVLPWPKELPVGPVTATFETSP